MENMLKDRILKVWKNYLTSQFLVTMFVFFTTWIAGSVTGLRFAFLNALAAGVCEVIPNFGPIISGVISALLALIFGSSKLNLANWQFAVVMIIICIVIQMLQNWLISPLIIGKKMDLHPVLVFVGMLVFSALFGFWGMILAVPIMATLKEVRKYNEEQKEQKPEDRLELQQNRNASPDIRSEMKQNRDALQEVQSEIKQSRGASPEIQPEMKQNRDAAPTDRPEMKQNRDTAPEDRPGLEQNRDSSPEDQA